MAVTDYGHIIRSNAGITETRDISALTGQTAIACSFHMTVFQQVVINPIVTKEAVDTEIFRWAQDTTDKHILWVWAIDNSSTTHVRVTATGY